jgi:hypothetical protein
MTGTDRMRAYRARRRAEGWKLVRGRWVPGTRTIRIAADPPPPHGTQARYEMQPTPCRCADCSDANSARMRAYRQGVPFDRHQVRPQIPRR